MTGSWYHLSPSSPISPTPKAVFTNDYFNGPIPGVGDGQGGLACCNSWGRKESDTTEQLI